MFSVVFPGDESQTFINPHSPCWALLWVSHSGWVSEYQLHSASQPILHDFEFIRLDIFILPSMSSFSLDRGSYTKGMPQIRIDQDSENNSFFWRKNSETDLWMNYPKIQQNQHKITSGTTLFRTIVPLHSNIFIFYPSLFCFIFLLLFMRGFKSEWINEVFVLNFKTLLVVLEFNKDLHKISVFFICVMVLTENKRAT